MTHCIERPLVDSHFRGELRPGNERRMRAHLSECASCKAHYRRRQILAEVDPGAPSPEDRLARGLGLEVAPLGPSRLFWPMLASALAVAAALVFVLRSPQDDGFHARGSIPPSASARSASTVGVYRVSDRTLLSASGAVRRDDELAFSYDNVAGQPYVMIFGVDEGGRVYWFYPAWTDESENPMAVKTDPGRTTVALPEAIKHPFQGARLTIHGLFLDTPLTVRDVEAALRDRRLDGMQGAHDQTTTFEVIR